MDSHRVRKVTSVFRDEYFYTDPATSHIYGLSYLCFISCRGPSSANNFAQECQQLKDLGLFQSHLDYFKTCPIEKHPATVLMKLRDENDLKKGVANLAILVSEGLDINRLNTDGKPLYKDLLLWLIKESYGYKFNGDLLSPKQVPFGLDPQERIALLNEIMMKKMKDSDFYEIFKGFFYKFIYGAVSARIDWLIECFVGLLYKISLRPASSIDALLLPRRSEAKRLIRLFQMMSNKNSSDNDIEECIRIIAMRWEILSISAQRVGIENFIKKLNISSLILLVEKSLMVSPDLAEIALETIGVPPCEDSPDYEHLKSILNSLLSERSMKLARIIHLPHWKIPILFTARFRKLIPSLANKEMVEKFLIAKKLQSNTDSNQADCLKLAKFYIRQGFISGDFKILLMNPIFEAILTVKMESYSKELLTEIGTLILRIANTRIWNNVISEVNPLIHYALHHIDEVGGLLSNLALEQLQICDGGDSTEGWSNLLERSIANASSNFLPQFKQMRKLSRASSSATHIELSDYSNKSIYTFLRMQGRTLIFERKNSTKLIAVKLSKNSEGIEELEKEANMQQWLAENASRLRLKSSYPKFIQLNKVTGVEEALNTFLTSDEKNWLCNNLIGNEFHDACALVYEADPDYFVYLHECDEFSDFTDASNKGLHDLLVLLDHGIYFNALADMFHNQETSAVDRQDGGRYLVFNKLIRDLGLGGMGTGRLNAWLTAVEFVNLRQSGLADVGDRKMFETDLFNNQVGITMKFIEELYHDRREHPQTRVIMNCIAEYLYVHFLVAGRRARIHSLGMSPESAFPIWLSHAELCLKLCAQTLAHYSDLDENMALYSLSKTIDINRLARQMQFWMTSENIPYLKKRNIPKDIYGEDTSIVFDEIRENTFNDKFGCSINPENGPDLGTVNGQEPIKEFNKLLYLTAHGIFAHWGNASKQTKYNGHNKKAKLG